MIKTKAVLSEKKAYCAGACLAGGNPSLWLHWVREGKFQKAWQELVKVNPLPAVIGRVCPHPCESSCMRALLDEALSINELEKFLGDEAMDNNWPVPRLEEFNDFKVAIIGSGPAGLSCAYQLGRRGYEVTIFEQSSLIGGMLRLGIPNFRLSRYMLDLEIENNILSLGVELETNVTVDRAKFECLCRDFDAVFVATGLQKSRKLNIPGEDGPGVLYGLDFLKKANFYRKVELGKKVIVIGGGNTAIDVARTVKKLGSESSIFYRRTKLEMPAIESEIARAGAEGIEIRELVSPVKILRTSDKNLAVFERMKLGEADETGRPKPVPIEYSNFQEEFDSLIIAAGEEKEGSFDYLGDEKVFISEDAGTVAEAIKLGSQSAGKIDQKLRGEEVTDPSHEEPFMVPFENLEFYLTPKERVGIQSGSSAIEESQRCFGCGFEIEGMAHVLINQGRCKGCGLCVDTCPYQLFELADSFNAQGYRPAVSGNPEKCRGCTLCTLICPDVAIEICRRCKDGK